METIFTSLIAQIKNPWQYICVGRVWCGVLYFGMDKQYLLPCIIASLGFAFIFKEVSSYFLVLLKIQKYKKNILFYLTHLNSGEKRVLSKCFFSNIQTISINGLYGDMSLWSSLIDKGIAEKPIGRYSMESLPLTISENVWKIIEKNADIIFAEYKNASKNK